MVGCDGAHSAVRHLLNLPFEGAEYDDLFMLADIETNEALPADELQLCPSEFGPVAIFPMSSTRRRIVATSEAEGDAPSLELVQKILGNARRWNRSARPALEQLFSHPSPPCREAAHGAILHRRRRRAHSQSVWRPGNEYRVARRLESGMEAGSRFCAATATRSCSRATARNAFR